MAVENVEPPSLARETRRVLQAAFHVAYWSLLVMFRGTASASAGAETLPFQTRFGELDAPDQRMFRGMQEGLLEAEARRSRAGSWPSAESLAQEGIPPFTRDPIDQAGYVFQRVGSGSIVNYVGTPRKDSGRATFLILVAEPAPGTAPDPQVQTDEIHHKLGDGTMIHVGIWKGPGLSDPTRAAAMVAPEDGWRQIIVGQPKR